MSVNDMDPHAQTVKAIEEGRPIEAQYVRQGKRNMRVVWVLVVSLALAALFTFGAWVLRAPELRGQGGQTSVSGEQFGPVNSVPAKQKAEQDPNAARRGSTSDAQYPAP